MKRWLILGLMATSPSLAETEDDGIAAFFECLEAEGDEAPCYTALVDAVPGWCPLMDNQIRSRQGEALIEAAREVDADHATFADDWDLCPELEGVSLPVGESKAALCKQQVGIKVLQAVRTLDGES